MHLPYAVEFVRKGEWEKDLRTGKQKRASGRTKNEMFHEIVKQCEGNLCFDYVATDSRFSSIENMKWAKEGLRRDFVMAL